MPSTDRYTSPEEMICSLKGHEWSQPIKDKWMEFHGDYNFYYHKCDRCAIEVKHVGEKCKPCKGTNQCDEKDSEEPHTCPFSVEINNNYDLCTCCRFCEKQCADDI